MERESQRESVLKYYSKTLQSSADLKSSACCPIDAVPEEHRKILEKIHPEVLNRFYGCGSPVPRNLDGCTVLDLGCGTGRDAFLVSALVGENGSVIGIDMTEEQLAVARKYRQYHADSFFGQGAKSNVDFRQGYIEDLQAARVGDASVDVVISNCVCNLSPDKMAVFSEVARVLRHGGEFYFSDIYADRRLPKEATTNEVLIGECLGGALYIEDFRRLMSQAGLQGTRVVSVAPVQVHHPDLKKLVPDVRFFSITTRSFKILGLEDRFENYGQSATYNSYCGPHMELDVDNIFEKQVARPVDGNTAEILQKSRFASQFTVTPRGPHNGLFYRASEHLSVGPIVNSFRPAISEKYERHQSAPCEPSSCCPSSGELEVKEHDSSEKAMQDSGALNGNCHSSVPSKTGEFNTVIDPIIKRGCC